MNNTPVPATVGNYLNKDEQVDPYELVQLQTSYRSQFESEFHELQVLNIEICDQVIQLFGILHAEVLILEPSVKQIPEPEEVALLARYRDNVVAEAILMRETTQRLNTIIANLA